MQEAEDLRICYVILSPSNASSYTREISPSWLPYHELNEKNNRVAIVDKDQEASTLNKNLQVMRNAESKGSRLCAEKNIPVSYLIPNSQP